MGYDCFLVAQLFFFGGGRMLLRGFVFQMTWTALTFSLWNRRVGDVGFKNRYYVGDIAFRYLKKYLQRLVTSRQFKIKHLRFWAVVSKICFFHPWGNDPTYSTSFGSGPFKLTGWILEPGKVETSKLAYVPTWDGWYFLYQSHGSQFMDPSYGFGIPSMVTSSVQSSKVGSAVRWIRPSFWTQVSNSAAGMGFFGCSIPPFLDPVILMHPVNKWAMKPGCLGFIGDHTTQLYKGYIGPLKGSLWRN